MRVYNIKTVEQNQPELQVDLSEMEMSMIFEGLRLLSAELVDNNEDTFLLDALFNKLQVVTV